MMVGDRESENPFQAPVHHADADEIPLPADSEFLVSDDYIICREQVELPPICIHTGETEDLQRRHEVLRAMTFGGTIQVVISILLIVTLVGEFGFLDSLMIALVPLVVLNLVRKFVLRNFMPLTDQVAVTWYVSKDYLDTLRWQIIAGRTLLLAIGSAVGFLSAGASQNGFSVVTVSAMLAGAIIGFLISFGMQVEQKPTLVGRRRKGPNRGLMMLRGHSVLFANAVRQRI